MITVTIKGAPAMDADKMAKLAVDIANQLDTQFIVGVRFEHPKATEFRVAKMRHDFEMKEIRD